MSILESGKAAIQRTVADTVPEGHTVAIVAIANEDGKLLRGAVALDTKTGEWEIFGELKKLTHQKKVGWSFGVLWSM